MKIIVTLKSLAKRRNYLTEQEYILPSKPTTLSDFLTELVTIEVQRYNGKETEAVMIPFLTNEEIEQQAEKGKVGFNSRYNDHHANLQKAIQNAHQAFEDGLFKVFQNDEEAIELTGPIQIQEGDRFTFIKLTMLAGRMW